MKQTKRPIIKLKKASVPDSKFKRTQLQKGMKVESEHSNDKRVQKPIAKAHLSEDPNYYKKLSKMEKTKPSKPAKSKR